MNSSIFDLLDRPAELMDTVSEIMKINRYFSAIVLQEFNPYNGEQTDIARLIAAVGLRREQTEDVQAASFMIQRKRDDLLVLSEASLASVFTGAGPGVLPIVDANFTHPTQVGLQLKADVSNLPTLEAPQPRPFRHLLDVSVSTLEELRTEYVVQEERVRG